MAIKESKHSLTPTVLRTRSGHQTLATQNAGRANAASGARLPAVIRTSAALAAGPALVPTGRFKVT